VEVCNCANTNLLQELLLELDSGESESIVLAIELNTPTLLMDEKDGREVALRFHLKPIGILGILIEAKKSGLVTSVRDCMDKLKSEAGFYLAESLYARVIELVGE
jgi:predicted nucleic acid-binding protein